MISFTLNGKKREVDVDPETPLLWVLRETLGMTGTKFGCGMAQCGACTVHVGGNPTRSCVLPIAAVAGQSIRTIEGLSAGPAPGGLHALQKAWIACEVPQCGYCQSGQLMSAAALLERNAHPSDQEIDDAMSGNICRCGTYERIRKAIRIASESPRPTNSKDKK